MTTPISPTLELRRTEGASSVCCRRCGHALAPAGEPWKPRVPVLEVPIRGAGGSAYRGGEEVRLRQFACPGCGTLLDTETAMAGDPMLNDIVSG